MKLRPRFIPLAISLSAVVASATEVAFNYAFTATGFTDVPTGLPAPFSTLSGSVSGTFTPDVAFFNPPTLSLFSLNINGVAYTIANTGGNVEEGHILPSGSPSGSFIFGGLLNTPWGVAPGTNDFFLSLDDHLGTGFGGGSMGVTLATAPNGVFHTFNVTFNTVSAGVPDSGSSLSLLTFGVLGLAAVSRKLRREKV